MLPASDSQEILLSAKLTGWLKLPIGMARFTNRRSLAIRPIRALTLSKGDGERHRERLMLGRPKTELEALRAEEQTWSFWGTIFRLFRVSVAALGPRQDQR